MQPKLVLELIATNRTAKQTFYEIKKNIIKGVIVMWRNYKLEIHAKWRKQENWKVRNQNHPTGESPLFALSLCEGGRAQLENHHFFASSPRETLEVKLPTRRGGEKHTWGWTDEPSSLHFVQQKPILPFDILSFKYQPSPSILFRVSLDPTFPLISTLSSKY